MERLFGPSAGGGSAAATPAYTPAPRLTVTLQPLPHALSGDNANRQTRSGAGGASADGDKGQGRPAFLFDYGALLSDWIAAHPGALVPPGALVQRHAGAPVRGGKRRAARDHQHASHIGC